MGVPPAKSAKKMRCPKWSALARQPAAKPTVFRPFHQLTSSCKALVCATHNVRNACANWWGMLALAVVPRAVSFTREASN